MDEAERQKKFAYYWSLTRNPEQAAIICGEPDRWIEWMENRQVLREMNRLQRIFKKESPGEIAKRGLEQIVFGTTCIREKLNSLQDGEAVSADGACAEESYHEQQFQVAEWKRPKGGGEEIKFWDKLKALELLIRLEEENWKRQEQGQDQRSKAVYLALENGAKALKEFRTSDCEKNDSCERSGEKLFCPPEEVR